MGTFTAEIEVGDPAGSRFETVDALVDTGATYTMLPASLLRHLGVTPVDSQGFILANGELIERDIGETAVRIDGRVRTSLVVFSDEDSRALLGTYTLEAFSIAADSVNGRLISVDALALGAGLDVLEKEPPDPVAPAAVAYVAAR